MVLSMSLISRWRSSSLCASRLTSAAVPPSPGSARGCCSAGATAVYAVLAIPRRLRLAFDEIHRRPEDHAPGAGCGDLCDPRGSVCCFYMWVHRKPTPTEVRRSNLGAEVKAAFEASKRTYGTPRIHADLVEAAGR